MSQDSTRKEGGQTVAIARAERGRFAPGHAGGPGRPKRGMTLAEQWRRETDWPKLRERLEGIVHDPKAKHADVVGAARELLDRSWGKPLAAHELTVNHGGGDDRRYDLDALSTDEVRQLMARIDAAELDEAEALAPPEPVVRRGQPGTI